MMKILIVDDDSTILSLLEIVLESQGHIVVKAESGEEALSLFSKGYFDLVITDICMPGICGNTLLKRIKDVAPQVPFVALTGEPESACELFDFVFSKPFKPQNLITQIERVIPIATKAENCSEPWSHSR